VELPACADLTAAGRSTRPRSGIGRSFNRGFVSIRVIARRESASLTSWRIEPRPTLKGRISLVNSSKNHLCVCVVGGNGLVGAVENCRRIEVENPDATALRDASANRYSPARMLEGFFWIAAVDATFDFESVFVSALRTGKRTFSHTPSGPFRKPRHPACARIE